MNVSRGFWTVKIGIKYKIHAMSYRARGVRPVCEVVHCSGPTRIVESQIVSSSPGQQCVAVGTSRRGPASFRTFLSGLPSRRKRLVLSVDSDIQGNRGRQRSSNANHHCLVLFPLRICEKCVSVLGSAPQHSGFTSATCPRSTRSINKHPVLFKDINYRLAWRDERPNATPLGDNLEGLAVLSRV